MKKRSTKKSTSAPPTGHSEPFRSDTPNGTTVSPSERCQEGGNVTDVVNEEAESPSTLVRTSTGHISSGVPYQTKEDDAISIDVVGDTFIEAFIWGEGTNSHRVQNLPYTWPDELRSHESTSRFRELSGAPLHADIFSSMLNEFCNAGRRPHIHAYPSRKACSDFVDKLDGGPFPVYLHRLAPFNAGVSPGRVTDSKVWRIAKSYGELRSWPDSPMSPSPGDARTLATKAVEHQIDSLKSGVVEWLNTRLPQQGHTAIVINDRNALKEQDPATSIRAVFGTLTNAIDSERLRDALAKRPPMVIWQSRWPLFENDSIDDMLDTLSLHRRTIMVINYNCLRDAGIPLRYDVSYETSVQTLMAAFGKEHSPFSKYLRVPHLLIRFDHGIMHISTDDNQSVTGIDVHGYGPTPEIFDSSLGIMLGTTPLLVGCLLSEIAYDNSAQDPFANLLTPSSDYPSILHPSPIDRAIDMALLLSALHFVDGYGPYESRQWPRNFQEPLDTTGQTYATAPAYGKLVKQLLSDVERTTCNRLRIKPDAIWARQQGTTLSRLSVDLGSIQLNERGQELRKQFSRIDVWTGNDFLHKVRGPQGEDEVQNGNRSAFQVFLHGIVERGLPAFTKIDESGVAAEPSIACPYVQIGKMISMESEEIDSILSLRLLVRKYLTDISWLTPLAVAVFGKPGTGKGFFVKESLSGVPGCSLNDKLEFNMLTWRGKADLSRALHLIKNEAGRTVPVAFFDEFDCTCHDTELYWPQHFLMPIQDGTYSDGNDVYALGKSILIFAGGTSYKYDDFVCCSAGKVRQKIPDFISRLRGHVNILDTSYQSSASHEGGGQATAALWETGENRRAAVRRAIALRGLLQKNVPQMFDEGTAEARIDAGLIDAFLGVKCFKHGVRSIEAIIQMSRLPANAACFHASLLPTRNQLDMHVDASDFLRFVQQGKTP